MSRRILLTVILALAAVSAALSQSRSPEIKLRPVEHKQATDSFNFEERPYFLLIEQSEKALEENDFEAAGLRLVEAMSVEPDNPLNVALLTNLGMIYYYNEQDSLALVTLTEAVRRSPKLVAAHEKRARVLIGMGRDNEAFEEYSAVIAIDSLNTDARYYHGMMALYRGDRLTAETDIAILNRVTPLSRETILATSTLYAMTGRSQEAISGYRKLIEIEKMPEYYASLAGCLIDVDNLNEASTVIGEGLEHFASDPELYYYRALLNHKRFEPDAAHRDAKRAIELGADPTRVRKIFQ